MLLAEEEVISSDDREVNIGWKAAVAPLIVGQVTLLVPLRSIGVLPDRRRGKRKQDANVHLARVRLPRRMDWSRADEVLRDDHCPGFSTPPRFDLPKALLRVSQLFADQLLEGRADYVPAFYQQTVQFGDEPVLCWHELRLTPAGYMACCYGPERPFHDGDDVCLLVWYLLPEVGLAAA